ncbi:hypothetical protein ACLB1G_21825 [Oxalobacteraceae bacterium A2-2]
MKRDANLYAIQAASATLDLFPAEVPAERSCRPPIVDHMWERAQSEEVRRDILAVFAAKPAQWLSWSDFRCVIKAHQIGACLGHVLFGMVREGKIIEKIIYFGTERPGPGYAGFTSNWGTTDTAGPRVEVGGAGPMDLLKEAV